MTAKKKTTKKPTKKKSAAKKKVVAKAKSVAPIVGDRPSNKKLDPKPKSAKVVTLSPWNPASLIATIFSVGRIPYAPGTLGSLLGWAAYPTLFLLPTLVASQSQGIASVITVSIALLVLLYTVGVLSIRSYQTLTGTKDAGEIIIDEFFGQILTFALIHAFFAGLAYKVGAQITSDGTIIQAIIQQVVPFAMFRLFDIAKPWPIWVIDKKDNRPSGVMLDDVVAAIYAAVASILVFFVINACCPSL